MYCRTCKYDLHRIDSTACPECGRAFDPDDPRTWEPVPSRPATSLAILIVALLVLAVTQLILGLVRPLLPAGLERLDGLLALIAPAGAFASGWYAERRAALLAYGGLALFAVVPAIAAPLLGDATLLGSRPVAQATFWIGSSLVLMFGCWAVGRFAWSLHARLERRRWMLAARGDAVRRRGPRPRTIVMALALVAAVVGGWAVSQTVRVMNGVAKQTTDLQTEIDRLRLDAADVGEAEAYRAWDDLAAALESVRPLYRTLSRQVVTEGYEDRFGGDSGSIVFRHVLRGRDLPPDIERERRAIDAFREAGIFDALARLESRPMAIGAAPYGVNPPPVSFAALARAGSMRLAADAGDFDEVVRAFEEILALARAVSYQGPIYERRSAGGVLQLATTELCHELMEYEFPEHACARLQAATHRLLLAPPELALECERRLMHDSIQKRFTDDGRGRGYRIATPVPPSWFERARAAFDARFIHPDRREERRRCDAAIDAGLAAVARPPHERGGSAGAVPTVEADRFAVVPRATQAVGMLLVQEADDRRAIAVTRLLIAIAHFRARHDRYPAALDELVPSVVADLPPDPVTGAAFDYRRLDDDPQGRPFVLSGAAPGDGSAAEPLTPPRRPSPWTPRPRRPAR